MSKIAVLLIGDIAHDGRVKKEIRSLKSQGHEVVLIYSASKQKQPDDSLGIQTILIPKKSGGSTFSILFRNLLFYRKVRRTLKKIKPDYVHCNDLNTFVMSFFRLKGVKYVYDAHEMNMGIPALFKEYILTKLENALIPRAHAVIVPQTDRLNLIRMKYRVAPEKLFLLENFPARITGSQTGFFTSEYDFRPEGRTVLSYSGVMDDDRCIKELICAMKYVDNAVLFLIGNAGKTYKESLETLIRQENLTDRIYLKPLAPQEKVLSIAQSTDIGICLYRPTSINNYFSASNKIYEYLSSGIPVIAYCTPGLLRLEDPHLFLVNKIRPEEIAMSIRHIQSHTGKITGRTEYAWENQEDILRQIYK